MCSSSPPKFSLWSLFSFNLADVFGESPAAAGVSSLGAGRGIAVGSGVKGDDADTVGTSDDEDDGCRLGRGGGTRASDKGRWSKGGGTGKDDMSVADMM